MDLEIFNLVLYGVIGLCALWYLIVRPLKLRNLRERLAVHTGHAEGLLQRLVKHHPNDETYHRWLDAGNPADIFTRYIMKYSLWSPLLGVRMRQLNALSELYEKAARVATFSATFEEAPLSNQRKVKTMEELHAEREVFAREIARLLRILTA